MDNLPDFEKDIRPWGQFERFTHNKPSTVKIITVNAGEEFSLQTHNERDEFWRVLSGYGVITTGDTEHDANPGDEFFIPRGTKHRARGGDEGLVFLEIAFGNFDEKDIVRIEDKYGRT